MSPADTLTVAGRAFRIADLPAFAGEALARMPMVRRIVLENLLRRGGAEGLAAARAWLDDPGAESEIPFHPGRIMMHDTTCGPALVDIAAGRSALAEAGGDPGRLNPVLRVDVSTDHSVAVDVFGRPGAMAANMQREMQRNGERYRLMKWATSALDNVTVHPPGSGIMHTINLERLATVVASETRDGELWAFPDSLIGTDSHTPMINGLGVLGWGVGGLEAESVMLGMPVVMSAPKVVGVWLTGALVEGVMATDAALAVTHLLRGVDLDNRFVEFFGPGVGALSAWERAVVANMAPEYGGATGYFPIDCRTLAYLTVTGRSREQIALVEAYARRQGLWFDPAAQPVYDQTLYLDLATVGVSLAGPRRPQDLITPAQAPASVVRAGVIDGLPEGAVAIAAITSCTNTSDPRLLVAAGLLARKARALGLTTKPWVKTSLAPGSPAAERYLARAGLLEDLEALGFAIVGFGCTTCIGNSGPLVEDVAQAVAKGARPVAVLSGNRNFPGRVHPQISEAYLASPPLVVAYALAGDIDRDILTAPIGGASDGRLVRLADLWPAGEEIDTTLALAARPDDYALAYDAAEANPDWAALQAPDGALYPWDPASTYIRRPPFAGVQGEAWLDRYSAWPLLVLGDDITTDHISPAGAVPAGGAAARYLIAHGEDARDLNVFAARRGNWEAMVRGLYTNKAVVNLLAPGIPAGDTIHSPSGDVLPLWDAARRYRAAGDPVVIVAGERYGMGSSRDWAAKGARLLGARAVLALSFERIHRSNLVNMGILPLRLPADAGPLALALKPGDRIVIEAPATALRPRMPVPVRVHRLDGTVDIFTAEAAVETGLEVEVLLKGGIIPLMLQQALATG